MFLLHLGITIQNFLASFTYFEAAMIIWNVCHFESHAHINCPYRKLAFLFVKADMLAFLSIWMILLSNGSEPC